MLRILWDLGLSSSLLLLAVSLLYLIALYVCFVPLWLYTRSKQITHRLLACCGRRVADGEDQP